MSSNTPGPGGSNISAQLRINTAQWTRSVQKAQADVMAFQKSVNTANAAVIGLNKSLTALAATAANTSNQKANYTRRANQATASTLRLTFGVRNLGAALGRMGSTSIRSMGALSLGLRGAAGGVALMTSSFTTLFGLIAGSGMGLLTRWSAEFQQNMIEVMTIVKEGEATIDELTEKVLAMSRMSGFDPTKMARATKIAISTDVDPAEIGTFMEEAMKLAISDGSEIEPVVRLMATLRKAFDLPMEALAPLRDVLFTAVDEGAVEINDLALQLGKVSPLARQAGIDMTEMMSAISAVSLGGFTPQQTITNFRNALTDLLDPTSKAQKAMRDLGINFTPAVIKARGFRGAIEELKEAMAKDPRALGDLAEDLRSLTFWLSIAGPQLDDYDRILEEVLESTGKNDRAYRMMAEGPMKKLERMWQALKTASIDASAGIVDWLMKMIGASNSTAAAQLKLTSYVKQAQAAIMIFFQVFREGWFGVNAALELFIGHWKEIFNLVQVVVTKIETLIYDMVGSITDALADLFGATSFAAGQLGMEGMEESLAKVEQNMRNLTNVISGANAEAQADFEEHWDRMGEGYGEALDSIAKMRQDMGIVEGRKAIQDLLQDVRDLRFEAENLEDLKFDPATAFEKPGDVGMLAGTRNERALEESELYNRLVKEVAQSVRNVKRLKKEEVKAYNEEFGNLKRHFREVEKEYKRHTRELERTVQRQLDFNRNVTRDIFDLKQVDRSPREQMRAVEEMALSYEKMGNSALLTGDTERAQKNVQDAMDMWKEMVNISPTKATREMAIAHLERLQEEMNAVFEKQKRNQREAAEEAKAEMAKTKADMEKLKANQKAWLDKVTNIVRLWEDMGRMSTEKLQEVETQINELMGMETVIKIDVDTSEAQRKVLELGNMIAQTITTTMTAPGQYVMTTPNAQSPHVQLPPRSSAQTPVEGAGPKKMAAAPGAGGTAINMGDINIEYHSTGGTDADARRLSKQIRRHITRGEVKPLGR